MAGTESFMAKQLTGDDNAFGGTGKVIVGDYSAHLPKDMEGCRKLFIAGTVIIDDMNPSFGTDWDMMEFDIIIVPKKIHTGWKYGRGRTYRDLLQGGFQHEENWEKETIL